MPFFDTLEFGYFDKNLVHCNVGAISISKSGLSKKCYKRKLLKMVNLLGKQSILISKMYLGDF